MNTVLKPRGLHSICRAKKCDRPFFDWAPIRAPAELMKPCRCRWLFCDHGSPLFGWLVLFPLTGHTPDSSRAAIDWLFVHLNAPFVCRIMIDGLWGKASMLCSQSLVPFSTYLGNPTWPALRMGSELFLGLCSVRLATASEIWPRLIKLHESSSLSSRNLRLILAHGRKAGLRGSQQL